MLGAQPGCLNLTYAVGQSSMGSDLSQSESLTQVSGGGSTPAACDNATAQLDPGERLTHKFLLVAFQLRWMHNHAYVKQQLPEIGLQIASDCVVPRRSNNAKLPLAGKH